MGIYLRAAVAHNFSEAELVDLPRIIDTWRDVHDFLATYNLSGALSDKAEWSLYVNKADCARDFSIADLHLNWLLCSADTAIAIQNVGRLQYSNSVVTSFGVVGVFKHTLEISHDYHEYWSMGDPELAKNILILNRLIAKHLHQSELLYYPDSGYQTALIGDIVAEGYTYQQVKDYAIDTFGQPPKDIETGRKNMFFIDDFSDPLTLSDWDTRKDPPTKHHLLHINRDL